MAEEKPDVDTAFALRIEDVCLTGTSGGTLPAVECEYCGERRASGIEFPLVPASHFADCIWHLRTTRIGPCVSWRQFEELNRRARAVTGDESLELVPNCCLGPIRVEADERWPETLHDIEEASPGGPMFRQSVLEALAGKGIVLRYQPATAFDSQGRPYLFGLVETTVHRILNSEKLPAGQYRQCGYCGDVKVLDYKKRPIEEIPLKGEFRASVSHLFRVIGYDGIVFLSDSLKMALEQIAPSGLNCKPLGRWG
jgi:hypothetical protein